MVGKATGTSSQVSEAIWTEAGKQRASSGIADRLYTDVDVKLRPVKLIGRGPFNLRQLINRGLPEPLKVLKR